jgi:hypothetical protein
MIRHYNSDQFDSLDHAQISQSCTFNEIRYDLTLRKLMLEFPSFPMSSEWLFMAQLYGHWREQQKPFLGLTDERSQRVRTAHGNLIIRRGVCTLTNLYMFCAAGQEGILHVTRVDPVRTTFSPFFGCRYNRMSRIWPTLSS